MKILDSLKVRLLLKWSGLTMFIHVSLCTSFSFCTVRKYVYVFYITFFRGFVCCVGTMKPYVLCQSWRLAVLTSTCRTLPSHASPVGRRPKMRYVPII